MRKIVYSSEKGEIKIELSFADTRKLLENISDALYCLNEVKRDILRDIEVPLSTNRSDQDITFDRDTIPVSIIASVSRKGDIYEAETYSLTVEGRSPGEARANLIKVLAEAR